VLSAPLSAAASPLALGSVYLSRYDLWPVTLTLVSLAFLVFRRFRLGLGSLGLATPAKVFPAVTLPLALTHVWRLRGRREALVCAGAYVGVVAATFLPFVVLSPGGVWDSLWSQASRPLQIESLGSGLMLAAHRVFGLELTLDQSHGSQNLAGDGAAGGAGGPTLVLIGALVAGWVWHAGGAAGRDRLLAASAAAVCAFVTFGKVLSPQFLIWLVPGGPPARGGGGG